MKSDPKKKRLSLDEAAALLGAERAEKIGRVRMDPISMRVIAEKIGRRLVSKGGRPTDTSWKMNRKVPMKEETWHELRSLAERLGAEKVRVAPGQLAAIALEHGLTALADEALSALASATEEIDFRECDVQPDSKEEAERLCPIISKEGIW